MLSSIPGRLILGDEQESFRFLDNSNLELSCRRGATVLRSEESGGPGSPLAEMIALLKIASTAAPFTLWRKNTMAS